jgi:hypothetical protein
MNETVLALLLSLLPITGGQFISLDERTKLLGEPPPNDLYSLRLTHPFESQTQKTNFAALCLAMDWDATRLFKKSTPAPEDLRLYSQYYLTSGGANALRFLKFHAQNWQTNWQAGPIEENVLKRLSLEASDQANDFFAKLAARADNVPHTRWFTWHNLMQERRKREAADLVGREHLNTNIACSVEFACRPHQAPRNLIPWPSAVRTELHYYDCDARQWTFSLTHPPKRPVYLPREWQAPQGKTYERHWQPGPSWQVLYQYDGKTLTRTGVPVEGCSYIAGQINTNGFQESLVATARPQNFVRKAPARVQVW